VTITNLFYPPEGPLAQEFFAVADRPGRVAVERWDLRFSWLSARL
jgi:hypothetical protein